MKNNKNILIGIILLFVEVSLLVALFSFAPQEVLAGVGSPNVTSISELGVANAPPVVQNTTINDDAAINLIPNSTKEVQCVAVIMEYDGEGDITGANATLFDSSTSQSNPDDNNDHYTNSSCDINMSFGSFKGVADHAYNALANCTFHILYYANSGNWNCTIIAKDTFNQTTADSGQGVVSELLAFGLPDSIDYGTVNATSVSSEQLINVTNYGNVQINVSLEGYGAFPNDGNAMNCSQGASKNISVELEKYNLSSSTAGTLSLTEFEATYINLSTTPVIKQFELIFRTNDTITNAIKESYWRIYVPKGVAGTCTGNIVFGATTSSGT
jgi:hypothetical protein